MHYHYHHIRVESDYRYQSVYIFASNVGHSFRLCKLPLRGCLLEWKQFGWIESASYSLKWNTPEKIAIMRFSIQHWECVKQAVDTRICLIISILLLFQSILKSTSLPGGGVNVFAALLHTHLAGKSILKTQSNYCNRREPSRNHTTSKNFVNNPPPSPWK